MTVELKPTHPLDAHTSRFADSPLGLQVESLAEQVSLRLDPAAAAAAQVEQLLGAPLPGLGRWSAGGSGVEALWLGPDEWLLVRPGAPLAVSGLAEELSPVVRPAGGAVVDVGAQRIAIRVAGPHARHVLAQGCALDLHPRTAGVGFAASTLLAHVPIALQVMGQGSREDGPAAELDVRLLVRTTFARHVADWLLDAGVELAGASV